MTLGDLKALVERFRIATLIGGISDADQERFRRAVRSIGITLAEAQMVKDPKKFVNMTDATPLEGGAGEKFSALRDWVNGK